MKDDQFVQLMTRIDDMSATLTRLIEEQMGMYVKPLKDQLLHIERNIMEGQLILAEKNRLAANKAAHEAAMAANRVLIESLQKELDRT